MSEWCPDESQIIGLTRVQIRDLIIECFIVAQEETLNKLQEQYTFMKKEEIPERVNQMVRDSFNTVNGNYENPSKTELEGVIDDLFNKATRGLKTPDSLRVQTYLNCIYLTLLRHHEDSVRRLRYADFNNSRSINKEKYLHCYCIYNFNLRSNFPNISDIGWKYS